MNSSTLEVGDVVLCTVDRISGTNVFVNLDDYENSEGSIVVSEIAPGRIRNLRDYVVPKKKIACKIVRIKEGNIELSLRRVTPKERKEVMDAYKLERRYRGILKSALGNKAEEIYQEIRKKETLADFIERAKKDSKVLEDKMEKAPAQKIKDIISSEKVKKIIVKRTISLKTLETQGIELIIELTKPLREEQFEVIYNAAGTYVVKKEAIEPKKTEQELDKLLKDIEVQAKKSKVQFEEKRAA